MIFSCVLLLYELHLQACTYRNDFHPVSYRSWREQNVIQTLLKPFSDDVNLKLLRPTPKGFHQTPYSGHPPPVLIITSLHLESVSTVKEQNMEFKAQFRFKQEWIDHRLSYDDRLVSYVRFTKDQMGLVWFPDTFFQNEKDGHVHNIDLPNLSFLVYPNGSIVYNKRLTMIFSCVMNFLKYPMDTQKCHIDFASYAYTTKDIIYVWKDEPLTIYQGAKSMLPNFVIRSFTNSTCSSITNTGQYSCLKIVLTLQRDFSFFLLQAYLPSTTLVAVAWVSYWIDWQATAARFPLVLFTLLTMIMQSYAINANLPPVSYTKAIDVWSGTCVMFIFTSLIEYAFVNYQGIKDLKPKGFAAKNYYQGTFGCHIWDKLIAWGRRKNRYLVEHLLHSDALFSSMTSSFSSAHLRRRLGRRVRGGPNSSSYDCRLDHVVSFDSGGDQADRSSIESDHVIRKRSPADQEPPEVENVPKIRLQTRKRVDIMRLCHVWQARTRAERIDFMFRILHPVAFVMFNIVYWSVYCT